MKSVFNYIVAPKYGRSTSVKEIDGKELILNCKPDIVFLDIRIDERSGLQMLKELKNPEFEVIFVTAFEQYAIDALRLSAVDYLLKPVDVDLLTASVSRVTEKIKSADLSDSLASLLSNLSLVDKFDKKTDYALLLAPSKVKKNYIYKIITETLEPDQISQIQ